MTFASRGGRVATLRPAVVFKGVLLPAGESHLMPNTPTVYVTRKIPEVGLDRLREQHEVVVWDGILPPETDHIKSRLASLDADGLVCLVSDEIDADVLDASSDLSVVSTFSVGYDHIDVAAAADRGIAVGHTPGVLTETTADLTWALLLACARRTVESHAYVEADEWQAWGPRLLTGPDVHDATLGIVGLGKIGTAVARRGSGFGMDVLYTGPNRKPDHEAALAEAGVDATFVDREELLADSDFVSLHVPLTEGTRGFIGTDELQRMRDEASLINTSRGGGIDTDALDTALERGWIARAGLDVTDPEPLPGDHPLLRHAPERLVVTPHIGSASVGTRNRIAEMAAANVEAGIDGRDLPNSALRDAGLE